MIDERLFRDADDWVLLVKRLTLIPNRGEPVVSWTIETPDSRILKPARTFGSKAELDLKLAVEGRKIGWLRSSVAFPVKDGTAQIDWFGIEEVE